MAIRLIRIYTSGMVQYIGGFADQERVRRANIRACLEYLQIDQTARCWRSKRQILDGSTDICDSDLIQQCWTFINNVKRGEPEAEKGKQGMIWLSPR